MLTHVEGLLEQCYAFEKQHILYRNTNGKSNAQTIITSADSFVLKKCIVFLRRHFSTELMRSHATPRRGRDCTIVFALKAGWTGAKPHPPVARLAARFSGRAK